MWEPDLGHMSVSSYIASSSSSPVVVVVVATLVTKAFPEGYQAPLKEGGVECFATKQQNSSELTSGLKTGTLLRAVGQIYMCVVVVVVVSVVVAVVIA